MQYSPKLKKAAEEIKAILKRNDIAACCVLHTPGFSEFIIEITPTYSCAKLEATGMRFRAKKIDFDNNGELRNERIKDTANMLNLLSTTLGKNAISLIAISEQFDKIVDAEHDKGSGTSHTTQNN